MSAPVSRASSYSPCESLEYTPLQLAVLEGSVDEVRDLLDTDLDINAGPDPALHLAIRKRDSVIAHLLLQAGADFEKRDSKGDCPIHIACALGLLDVVYSLCALGCSVEVVNAKGLYPLHLAAKYGHIEVVRCLCAAGCNIDVRNSDKIKADITALKYGHNDIAELIDRLRATGHRDSYARQLVPTSKPAVKLSVRLLGHCGVGKTAFAKSLGAGLFSSLFRRSSSLQSNKSRPSSPINTHIEMDVTSRQNSITFETSAHYHSTKGVHVQNMDISSVGEITVWEFSGHESYFPVFHNFLWPSTHTLTAVLFSLEDPPAIQVQQVCFWLNFILARQPAELPTSVYGPIVLVATHVDNTRAIKNQHGDWVSPDTQKTLETVKKLMPHVPKLMNVPVIVDCNLKHENAQHAVGTWTGLLEATLSWLGSLQKEYEQFPVLTRDTFAELLHSHVNPLALDSHINELLQQLHSMGEVFCVQDLVVINIQWLGTNLLGELLSSHFLIHARATGVYTAEDFQAVYNECDALGVLELLESLNLCVKCDIDGEVEYEFPVYNQTETIDGLWEPDDPRYSTRDAKYGGLRLYTPPDTCHLLTSLFPYLQVELRKTFLAVNSNSESDAMDLYQWYHGSKFCYLNLECMITLDEDENSSQYIEIKVRGPRQSSHYCFYFLEQILQSLDQATVRICPGLIIERHILSAFQLQVHHPCPFTYEPHVISTAMLEAESTIDIALYNPEIGKTESIVELVLFDDVELANNIHWGCALKIEDIPPPVMLKLCGLLDPPDVHGRDWCLLALKLGLAQETIAALDSQHISHTMRLLTSADCTIGALVTSLHELDRLDAAEVVLRSAPLFKVIDPVLV